MANTNINIRMDADLKRQFEAFCSDMGMTMTTAFNIFARKAVREYRIPFEISGDIPNAETASAIEEVKKMKANPCLGKTYSDVDQMMEDLLDDV
ncbi:MAG: type II toxin-antitoxin system RelB/DinJ family antitoxin [Bacteroidales bacterium]|nr:type II toxin-antitoxin system RelB/DinJ family antitoxin [Lachnoclostridium sp.]MCM1385513.1 type II toxin-antitoxin system RelB/DinJ family antitoxin [Lachnoclostridium sp.]MCM1466315.1 type II toxin-antitoxin system RelB/DinJ family antitoxin [Bacteroidales bacterium]